MIGPLPSPHEKALRLWLEPPRLPVVLLFEFERFEVRLWVRVAINSSLLDLPVSTVRGGCAFLSRSAFSEPFGASQNWFAGSGG
jgi:hypothetical protein